MNRILLGIILLISALSIMGCASSMTPSQFLLKLPDSTSSSYYDRQSANTAISSGKCKILVADRKYTAPIGLTVHDDLRNGAKGVDEWVRADNGNAYIVNNFEWISVGDSGATQLIIYFDTMHCK